MLSNHILVADFRLNVSKTWCPFFFSKVYSSHGALFLPLVPRRCMYASILLHTALHERSSEFRQRARRWWRLSISFMAKSFLPFEMPLINIFMWAAWSFSSKSPPRPNRERIDVSTRRRTSCLGVVAKSASIIFELSTSSPCSNQACRGEWYAYAIIVSSSHNKNTTKSNGQG